jgi:hypothetical protein
MSGIGTLARLSWWQWVTLVAAVFSFFLCIIGWPDSRIGVFVNVAIFVFLLVGGRMGWLPRI